MCFLPSLSASVVGSGGWGSVERAVEVIREVGEPGDPSGSHLHLLRPAPAPPPSLTPRRPRPSPGGPHRDFQSWVSRQHWPPWIPGGT